MSRLNLEELQKQYDDVNTRESYVIDKEKGLMILFYPRFSEGKIEKLRNELADNFKLCRDNKIDFFQTDAEFYSYLHFLIVKHFTHLEDEISDKFEEQILQFQQLYETGLMKLILSDVLPQDQIQRVYDNVLEFAELTNKVATMEEDLKKMQDSKKNNSPKPKKAPAKKPVAKKETAKKPATKKAPTKKTVEADEK